MAYEWNGMRRIPWGEIKDIARRKSGLSGYFLLHDDGTESMIGDNTSWVDIVEHYENGGEFGKEIEMVDLELPDGKKIKAPAVVDISGLTDLDSLEYNLWHTIEDYLAHFGISYENNDPNWATVKEVQECLLALLERCGVKFKYS